MIVSELTGQRIGGYELEDLLGAGGFGAVYRGRLMAGGQTFGTAAVKVLDPLQLSRLRDPLREVRLGLEFDHPNLVKLLPGALGDAEVTDARGNRGEVTWFAMEIAEGSLADRIYPGSRRQPGVALGADEVAALARDIAAALAWLHARGSPGLVHRDVKPENILRVGSAWKLADFGIARAASGNGSTRGLGTEAYMPLEALERPRQPQPSWDAWALGVTLLEAATGRHPMDGLKPEHWDDALAGARPFALPMLPAPLGEVLAGLLTAGADFADAAARRWTAARAAERLGASRAERRTQPPSLLVPELVRVPAGRFLMGTPATEEGRCVGEGPQHWVTIGQAFEVGKYPVTFEEWDACVADGGCDGYRPGDQGWGRGRRPVINVSWEDAQGYVTWLSRRTGERWRLLTESEWEYAARGGTTTARYWGATQEHQHLYANGADQALKAAELSLLGPECDVAGGNDGYAYTSPVGSFRPNGFGLFDMLGNVWEWTMDCWNATYDGAPSDGSAWTSGACASRVVRGGSWANHPCVLRSGFRSRIDTGNRSIIVGFRVARTLTP